MFVAPVFRPVEKHDLMNPDAEQCLNKNTKPVYYKFITKKNNTLNICS